MNETLPPRQATAYSFGRFGTGLYTGLNNAILGLYISLFTGNPFIIGYVGNARTIEGTIIQPLIGRWSDRTTSRLGRRRPFILVGIPLAVLFLVVTPVLGHLRGGLALPLVVGSIALFSIAWNVAGDPFDALLIDITPEHRRTRFNGILCVVSLVGQIAIVLAASVVVGSHGSHGHRGHALASSAQNDVPDMVFYVCAILMLVSFAVVLFGVREPKRATAVAAAERAIPWRTAVAELRRYKEALKLLVSVFFLWTGLNAILPFLTIFPKKVMHASSAQALVIYAVIILASALFSYPFGRWGARYGTRRCLLVGTVLLIGAALLGMVVPTYGWLFPVAILAGCGFAATTVLTFPYLAELVPAAKIGVFTGLQAAFSSAATPVSLVATGALITHFGYRSIFGMLALAMVCDLAVLLTIDESAARCQVAQMTGAGEPGWPPQLADEHEGATHICGDRACISPLPRQGEGPGVRAPAVPPPSTTMVRQTHQDEHDVRLAPTNQRI